MAGSKDIECDLIYILCMQKDLTYKNCTKNSISIVEESKKIGSGYFAVDGNLPSETILP